MNGKRAEGFLQAGQDSLFDIVSFMGKKIPSEKEINQAQFIFYKKELGLLG